jgi:hypothetical protein
MADRYIIHGATFNGNGTSSAAAASNGGVGAWNNINVLEGTAPGFGTLAAGDTVYIRSKDAAGADITRTMTAAVSLGSTAATLANYITWVLDDGTRWPGVDGVLTYTHASTWNVTVRQYNRVVARRRGGLLIRNTSLNQAAGTRLCILSGELIRPVLDWSAKTGAGEASALQMGSYSLAQEPLIIWGRLGGNATDTRGLIAQLDNSSTKSTLIAPDIQLLDPTPGLPVFYSGGGAARGIFNIIGGEISGPGATSTQPLYRQVGTHARFRSVGLRFPRTMDVLAPPNVGTLIAPGEIEIIGCDEGVGGHIEKEWGFATSRTDSNPPTLAATLPDAAGSPWSWRVYPKAVTNQDPMALTSAKMFTGAAEPKLITQEVLVADTMAPHKGSLWITVEYQDAATGEAKHVNTRDWASAALDASTADWSASVWGAVTFVKRKLSVTTPTAVKPNTPIYLTLWGTVLSASANDILFVDPDFGVV